MRLSQLVCHGGLHPLACQPALHQFEQDDRLRLVDVEKDRRMDIDADEDDPRVVGRGVAGITLLSEPCLPIGLVELADLPRSLDTLAIPDADTHS
jgi:hypothetical protein